MPQGRADGRGQIRRVNNAADATQDAGGGRETRPSKKSAVTVLQGLGVIKDQPSLAAPVMRQETQRLEQGKGCGGEGGGHVHKEDAVHEAGVMRRQCVAPHPHGLAKKAAEVTPAKDNTRVMRGQGDVGGEGGEQHTARTHAKQPRGAAEESWARLGAAAVGSLLPSRVGGLDCGGWRWRGMWQC